MQIIQELADITINRALQAQEFHSEVCLGISTFLSILMNSFIPHSLNVVKILYSKSGGVGDMLGKQMLHHIFELLPFLGMLPGRVSVVIGMAVDIGFVQ